MRQFVHLLQLSCFKIVSWWTCFNCRVSSASAGAPATIIVFQVRQLVHLLQLSCFKCVSWCTCYNYRVSSVSAGAPATIIVFQVRQLVHLLKLSCFKYSSSSFSYSDTVVCRLGQQRYPCVSTAEKIYLHTIII